MARIVTRVEPIFENISNSFTINLEEIDIFELLN